MADMMNMEDDEPDFTGPLAQAGAAPQGALTPEQMQMPDNIRQMFESGRKMFEGANFGDIEARNRAAIEQKREALRRGREMLMAQKPDNTALLLALAQGFLSPTRSGSFFESLGNAGGAAIPAVNAMNQQRRQREQGLADFDVRAADLESDATKSEYDLLLKRAGLGQRQMQTAAQIDARRQQQLAAQNAAAERERARREAATATADQARAARRRNQTIVADEELAAFLSERSGFTVKPGEIYVEYDPQDPKGTMRAVPGAPRPTGQPRETPMQPEDRERIAEELGVPLAIDPTAGMSPKAAESVIREQNKNTEVMLREMREAVATGRASMADYRRFEQLLERQNTGGWYGAPIIGGPIRAIAGMTDSEIRTMQSIADRITPTMRQPGSGATSDFDARMFQSATVGVDKPAATNLEIIRGAQAAQRNLVERLAFFESYATANRGSLRGADEAWERYLNANPIFDEKKSKEGAPVLNANRKSWREYFRAERASALQRPTPAPRPATGGNQNDGFSIRVIE